MPLYEGLSSTITDKLIVVIDIGAAYTKYETWFYIAWIFNKFLFKITDLVLLENSPQDV